MVGENVEKGENAQILREMSADGHLIGNHTYHHVICRKCQQNRHRQNWMQRMNWSERITGKYPIYAGHLTEKVPENGDVDRQRFI